MEFFVLEKDQIQYISHTLMIFIVIPSPPVRYTVLFRMRFTEGACVALGCTNSEGDLGCSNIEQLSLSFPSSTCTNYNPGFQDSERYHAL